MSRPAEEAKTPVPTPRLLDSSTSRLLVASRNRAKAAEIAAILHSEGLDLEVISLADFPDVALPPETGRTFAENAIAKAKYAAAATGLPAVADDSGLEVDALGGEPGVMSARYGGPDATDRDRYEKVLNLLRDAPDDKRTARFRCAAAYAAPDGETLLAEGAVEGRIAREPSGSGGFGYDPIFVPAGETRTMAQLTPEEKHAISHRGRAFRALARTMREL
jgi:XTP/dITP diphosphohydrolase